METVCLDNRFACLSIGQDLTETTSAEHDIKMSEKDDLAVLRVLLFAGLMFLIVLMSPVLAGLFAGTEMYALVGTGLFFLTFGLFYIIVYTFVKLEGGSSIGELGAELEDRDLVPHLAIGALVGSIAVALIVLIALIFGGELRPFSEITGDLIASQIIITVPTAFFEELAYRGYLMPRMSKIWGRGKGIILSSLLFGLFHFSWWSPLGSIPVHLILLFTFNMTLGGIVLSLSYFMSGNKLWVPIGFHFSWNMIAYLLFPTYPRVSVYLPEIFQIEWGLTTILGFLFGLSLLWILLQQFKQKE